MLLNLFISFFKIGLFTFGGGYAMLPVLEKEVCVKNKWLDYEQLLEFYAIAQSTPGVISVNVATYVGYIKSKTLGSIVSVIGITLPSIIIIILIAMLNNTFYENPYLTNAFKGISVVVTVLISKSILKMFKNSVNNLLKYLAFLLIVFLSLFTNIHILFFVIFSAVFTMFIHRKKENKKC